MDILNIFAGQQLKEVYGLIYFEANIRDFSVFDASDIIEYELIFDKDTLNIRGDWNAVSLNLFVNNKCEDIDMNGDGLLKKIPLNKSNIKKAIGQPVRDIRKVFYETSQTGITIVFNDIKIIFINIGDDIYTYNDLPQELLQHGYHT